MHGFKSFANKEVMKLGQGITTVVGPNGCGKTNIVDAIRWVLGEQKYSILRSGKMEDVIFNGAEGTKPLGVCEVAMTVHNNAGKLPIEFNDIEIARRVYRSGESEYYLNKTQCRLKDIMDLFVDTGMGADAYSVIELKMIEQILSETADDRRKMFEEAAGIHKYRSQRKSTIRRFDITHTDLERVQDIIAEVEQKVHHLELQLKRFKRHATLTENLQVKDKELAFLQIHRFNSIIAPLEARIQEYRHIRETKSSESSVHEKELEQFRETYKSQELELNELQKIINGMNEERESLRNKILICTEKGRGALLTVDRLDREKSNNFQKIENLKQLKLDFDKEINELEPAINEYLNKYKSQKKEYVLKEKEYQQNVHLLDKAQNERWELQRKIAENRSLYERTDATIADKGLLVSELKDRIQLHHEDKKNIQADQSHLEIEKVKADKNFRKRKDKLQKIKTTLEDLKNVSTSVAKEKYSITALIQSLSRQRDFYKELVESREGFPEGTRYVLENPKKFPGVLGTIADMFQVDEHYRDALESGLGDLSHCLIAKDRESALYALETANKNEAGDLTIIPLKEAAALKTSLNKLPIASNIHARASDLVKTSEQLQPLADYLLGDLLVVDELKSVFNTKDLIGWNLVDMTGAYYGQNLIMKNNKAAEDGYIMGRQKKLEIIISELNTLSKNHEQLAEQSEDLSASIVLTTDQLKVHSLKLEEDNQSISNLKLDLVRNQMLLDQNQEQLKAEKEDLDHLEAELKQAEKALRSLKPAVDKDKEKLKSYEEVVTIANETMMMSREGKDNFQNLLQDTRIKLIELESRRDQLRFKQTSGKETSDELNKRQESIDNEIAELDFKQKELNSEVSESEKGLDSVNAEIQKQRSIIDLKQSVYRETYQNIEEIQARISAEQRDREQILENLKNSELEASETEQKIALVQERIRDRYSLAVPKDIIVDQTEEQLEVEIAKTQRSLENIGPVNMAVQDEYNEELERLETLSVQRDDLLEAEENLRETIKKIDKVARKRFQETFDLVRANFESLFKLFFEGGNSTLKLAGDPDPLEADISIEAQPPGKRNTSLRLLSSGEKALTAISLLFAIYQVKPSPYCILDEVDAPLDDVNIHKFTKVLSKFCDETQFIIVTHNKLTMEIADYMYGVTQEKKGISKLVSVKFD